MADSAGSCPPARAVSTDEGWDDNEHAAKCSPQYGTLRQELRVSDMIYLVVFQLLLLRLEHKNCYHAIQVEMSGLQKVQESGKSTLPVMRR